MKNTPRDAERNAERIPPDQAASDADGRWLVLIGGSGETSADDIEAFFAEIWPDMEPESTIH